MMTLENIIVFIIIAVCVCVTVRGLVRKFKVPKGGNKGCSSCTGCPVSDACNSSKKEKE